MRILDRLKRAWELWKKVGHFMGNIVGRVVLTLLYFTVIAPFGLGVRLLSDPLAMKLNKEVLSWNSRPKAKDSLEEARRQ